MSSAISFNNIFGWLSNVVTSFVIPIFDWIFDGIFGWIIGFVIIVSIIIFLIKSFTH